MTIFPVDEWKRLCKAHKHEFKNNPGQFMIFCITLADELGHPPREPHRPLFRLVREMFDDA
jgi:hypothetical protein